TRVEWDNRALMYTRNTYDALIDETLGDYAHAVEVRKSAEYIGIAAELLSAGKIVGWFQDGSEIGPRALGNRSILADPRRAEIREFLNRSVKRREPFRPFAPSVLSEFAPEWVGLS